MTKPRIGVDVGGTFTDAVVVQDGEITVTKEPTTPEAPQEAVVDAVREAIPGSPTEVEALGHASTVATNAVLENELAETALVTNKGFRDALEIARQDRPEIYDLHAEKPGPPVTRDMRYEVEGRIGMHGQETEPLDNDGVEAAAHDLDGVEAVAVSMLFSYEDPTHERSIRDVLERRLDAAVSLSSEVHPEIREYERTLVTCLDAGLKPVIRNYLQELQDALHDLGVTCDVRVMQSNGGVASIEAASSQPVRTLLSGPAAGAQAASYVAGLRGDPDVITMDMGGTSCDVSLVRDGEPSVTTEQRVAGHPIPTPMVDVHTIGSGGGSIAWVDDGGALRVGPRSAGADPGPVCYGRGGSQPTVTDAHHVLGRIEPSFVDDPLDKKPVRESFEEVADHLGSTPEEAALGVLEVADSNMLHALRLVSVERGHDPRNFSLVAFGGAGPLHAPRLARELGAPRVLVPRAAGVLSALGLQCTDAVHTHSKSMVRGWSEVETDELREVFREFRREGAVRLENEGFRETEMSYRRWLDMRYRGQSHELRVPADDLSSAAERFHELHRERYGHAYPDEPLELVTVRLDAVGENPRPSLEARDGGGSVDDAAKQDRIVVYRDGERSTPVYSRGELPVGGELEGPAVVEGGGTTVAVPPDARAEIDGYGNVVVEVGDG